MSTTNTTEKPKKDRAEEATRKVQEAISRAAGEVLMRAPQTVAKRSEIASAMTALGTEFAELSASAWGAE